MLHLGFLFALLPILGYSHFSNNSVGGWSEEKLTATNPQLYQDLERHRKICGLAVPPFEIKSNGDIVCRKCSQTIANWDPKEQKLQIGIQWDRNNTFKF